MTLLLTDVQLSRVEKGIAGFMLKRGYTAPKVESDFE